MPSFEFVLFGDLKRGIKFLLLWTPVVCTGGPKFANPPNKSVKPPRADKLDKAFNAPGLANNWARGIADARGFESAEADDVEVGDEVIFEFVVDDELLPFDVLLLASCRFAFCSSTLWDKRRIDLLGEEV